MVSLLWLCSDLLNSSHLVMHAILWHGAENHPVQRIDQDSLVVGNLVAVGTHMLDEKGLEGLFFVFPDLSIRSEGQFRLYFSLYDLKR